MERHRPHGCASGALESVAVGLLRERADRLLHRRELPAVVVDQHVVAFEIAVDMERVRVVVQRWRSGKDAFLVQIRTEELLDDEVVARCERTSVRGDVRVRETTDLLRATNTIELGRKSRFFSSRPTML